MHTLSSLQSMPKLSHKTNTKLFKSTFFIQPETITLRSLLSFLSNKSQSVSHGNLEI